MPSTKETSSFHIEEVTILNVNRSSVPVAAKRVFPLNLIMKRQGPIQ